MAWRPPIFSGARLLRCGYGSLRGGWGGGGAPADILGGQTFAMRLWLDPERMAGRGVSPDDVSKAILANNFQAAAGQTKGYFIVSNVTANTDLQNVDQFKRMVVKAKDGGFVRMQDIATIE